jgi:hypothetical protein
MVGRSCETGIVELRSLPFHKEKLMRITRTLMLVLLLAALLPADARAQNLAGMVKRLFDNSTYNRPTQLPTGATVQHQPHFIVGENLRLVTRQLNVALASQLASFPLASSSGGFTFSVNDRGEVTPTSTNFGPSFAERGVTIGRNQFNLGFTFQTTGYSSFEGADLEDGELDIIREHNDCCPGGVGIPTNPTNLVPDFERDLLRSRLQADIQTNTTAFFANYGVSDRFDIGVAVPFVNVDIDATVNSEILRLGSGTSAEIHIFENGTSALSLSDSGSASGLGDVLLRAKYNFLRTPTAALAGALDLRLPTGDKDNLLGTGATQTKLFFVGSGEYGRFSPHVNFGYTFSNGETSDEAVSFDLDPARFALSTLGSFVPREVDLKVPDEMNYVVGFSVAPSSRLTLGFDLHGRTIRDVPRFSLQNRTYAGRGPGATVPSTSYTESGEFFLDSTESGNLNLMLGVVGGKINIGGTFLLNVTVLFPMSDDGLKPKPTPVIGFDYVF